MILREWDTKYVRLSTFRSVKMYRYIHEKVKLQSFNFPY